MTDSELIGMLIAIILYIIVGIKFTISVFNAIDKNGMAVFNCDNVVYEDNIDFIEEKAGTLSFIVGALWPFFTIFACWSEIGRHVYEDIIIDGDEESRIASWVV